MNYEDLMKRAISLAGQYKYTAKPNPVVGCVIVKEKTINGLVYDSGTDSGKTFKSSNDKTFPKLPISLITSSPLGASPTLCTVTFTKK